MTSESPYTLASPAPTAPLPFDDEDWLNICDYFKDDDVVNMREFIASRGGPEFCLKQTMERGCTILSLAAANAKTSIVAALLDMKADPNFKGPLRMNMKTPPLSAFQICVSSAICTPDFSQNWKDVVGLLLKHGANLFDRWHSTKQDSAPCNTIETMFQRCSDNVCETILDASVGTSLDPLAKHNADGVQSAREIIQDALLCAIISSRTELCKTVISKFGANPILTINEAHFTPLMLATKSPGRATSYADGVPYPIAKVISGPVCSVLINEGAFPLARINKEDKTPYWVISKLHHTMYPGMADAFIAMHEHITFRTHARFFLKLNGRKKTPPGFLKFFHHAPMEIIQHILWCCLPKTSTIPRDKFVKYLAKV